MLSKIDALEVLLHIKHLPGKHDQSTHAGSRGRAAARGLSSATINAHGTTLDWKAEDTITGDVILEFSDSVDGDNLSDEDVKKFISDKLPGAGEVGAAGRLGKGDIEDVSILEREGGAGWLRVSVDITPTEEAGARWLEGEEASEEWSLYHGQ